MAATQLVRSWAEGSSDTGPMGSRLLARDRVLPATALLAGSLPLGGLQRGTTTIVAPFSPASPAVPGSTTLALELLAGVSMAGHWCAAVGLGNLGIIGARERGIALERFFLVPSPGGAARWQQVLATLFDGVDAVLFAPFGPVRPSDSRKLSARAKERGSMLIVLDRHGRWSEPGDLCCRVTSSAWSGLTAGHGLLADRSIEIEVSGRGAATRPRRTVVRFSDGPQPMSLM
ncbi:MAG: hypothetical protein ACYCSF_11985 [Acidimicrobiales bacterium]